MAIFDIHHPWAFTFGILGNIVSICVFLAPVPTFIRIHKEKSTMGFDSLPYAVALFSSMLWMYYAFIKTNAFLLITINAFGCVIETIYLFIFLFYASKKARTHTAKVLGIMNVALMSLIFLFTFFTFHGGLRVQVVGWICVAVSVSVFAAPLSIVFQVVRTRSVEFMPFPLSFFLTLTAIMWFGYGLLQRDLCVALPNVIGFVLGLVQMLLYGIYRNSKDVEIEGKKSPENVINVVVVDAPEVYSDKVEGIEDGIKKGEEEEEEGDIESRVPCAMSVEPSPAVSVQPVLIVCAA